MNPKLAYFQVWIVAVRIPTRLGEIAGARSSLPACQIAGGSQWGLAFL